MGRISAVWNAFIQLFDNFVTTVDTLPRRKRFRAVLRAVFLAIGVTAAYAASILFEEKAYYWALLPSAVVLCATLAEFVLADIITEARYPTATATILERLDRNLAALHGQIRDRMAEAISTLRGCDQERVSATLHLVVELYGELSDQPKAALLQVTDYTGTLGGRRWRFTEATKGLIGRCLRMHQAVWVSFANQQEYELRMVLDFGYSPEEVASHTKQARSYFAEPVFLHERLVGVLYLFSTEPQVFPTAVDRSAFTRTAAQIAGILEVAGII